MSCVIQSAEVQAVNIAQPEIKVRLEIWIEWGGKLADGTPRRFGPYASWTDAKQDGFKEPKENA